MVTQAAQGRTLVTLADAALAVGLNKKTLYRYYRVGEVYGEFASKDRIGWTGRPPLLVDLDDVWRLLEGTPAVAGRRRPTVEGAEWSPDPDVAPRLCEQCHRLFRSDPPAECPVCGGPTVEIIRPSRRQAATVDEAGAPGEVGA